MATNKKDLIFLKKTPSPTLSSSTFQIQVEGGDGESFFHNQTLIENKLNVRRPYLVSLEEGRRVGGCVGGE